MHDKLIHAECVKYQIHGGTRKPNQLATVSLVQRCQILHKVV